MRVKGKRHRSKNTYTVYKKLFRRAEKQFERSGLVMHDALMLSKQEFYDQYRNKVLENKKLPKSEQSRNITRDIVESQKYKFTQKFAKHLKEGLFGYYKDKYKQQFKKGKKGAKFELEAENYAYKQMKKHKVSITNIRTGVIDYQEIEDEYWTLKDLGYSGKEAHDIIAGFFDPDSP